MGDNLQYFELNRGAKIPSIAFGTYSTASEMVVTAIKMRQTINACGYCRFVIHEKYNNGETWLQGSIGSYITVYSFIFYWDLRRELGYRHIDCAHIYKNEKQIGEVLKQLFEEGVVKREELFITSKLWNYDHEPEDVPKALDRTLADLQLDYLDLYLIHWPVKEKKGPVSNAFEKLLPPDIPGTWKAMEELYDSGKVRAIGVSNFSTKKLQDLLEVARVPPSVNQVECHPMWQQENLHKFCKSKGIHLSAYSPLGSQSHAKKIGGLFESPILGLIAEELGKSPAQVALRWGIQMGHSILPKTSSEARLKQNLDLFDWSIPENLISKFSEFKQVKFVQPMSMVHEKSAGYKTLEELWDGEL